MPNLANTFPIPYIFQNTSHHRSLSENRARKSTSHTQERAKSASPTGHPTKTFRSGFMLGWLLWSQIWFPHEESFKANPKTKKIRDKGIEIPLNFKGALMVTTFVSMTGVRTHRVRRLLQRASNTELDVRLAELEHPFFSRNSKMFAL